MGPRVAALVAQVERLEDALSSPAPVATRTAAPRPVPTPDVDQRDLDVIEDELAALSTSVSGLSSDLDALARQVAQPGQYGPPLESRLDEVERRVGDLRDCLDDVLFGWTDQAPPFCTSLNY